MKITKSQLKQIIKEELEGVLDEASDPMLDDIKKILAHYERTAAVSKKKGTALHPDFYKTYNSWKKTHKEYMAGGLEAVTNQKHKVILTEPSRTT